MKHCHCTHPPPPTKPQLQCFLNRCGCTVISGFISVHIKIWLKSLLVGFINLFSSVFLVKSGPWRSNTVALMCLWPGNKMRRVHPNFFYFIFCQCHSLERVCWDLQSWKSVIYAITKSTNTSARCLCPLVSTTGKCWLHPLKFTHGQHKRGSLETNAPWPPPKKGLIRFPFPSHAVWVTCYRNISSGLEGERGRNLFPYPCPTIIPLSYKVSRFLFALLLSCQWPWWISCICSEVVSDIYMSLLLKWNNALKKDRK